MSRSRTFLFATAVVLAAVTNSYADEKPIHGGFRVGDGGTLHVDADLGDVRVVTGASGNVSVDVNRDGSAAEISAYEVTFNQEQNDVYVRGKFDESRRRSRWTNHLDVDYVITVPAHYNVVLRTSGGDMTVGDLQGSVDLSTSGGDVKLGAIGGPVKARTSGGSIDVQRAGGDVNIHTSGGSIRIDDAIGVVNADTSGGSIVAKISRQPQGDSRLSTSGGGVTVSFAPAIAVDVDARTSGGDIDSSIPITVLGRQSDGALSGKINGGGPRVVVRASGGTIRLRGL